MKQNVSEYDFRDAFKIRKDNFSYEGLKALYDYLINYEEEIGEEIELDAIGFCCEYSEYENLKEFQADYGKEYKTIEDIENETQVIPVNKKGFIIQDF
jgi:hypothetical protein